MMILRLDSADYRAKMKGKLVPGANHRSQWPALIARGDFNPN